MRKSGTPCTIHLTLTHLVLCPFAPATHVNHSLFLVIVLSQVESLDGAAHLLKDHGGVLRWAEYEQKSHSDHEGKSFNLTPHDA